MTPHQRLHVFLGDRCEYSSLPWTEKYAFWRMKELGEKSGCSQVGSRLSLKSNSVSRYLFWTRD
jgi:hypothetical protein